MYVLDDVSRITYTADILFFTEYINVSISTVIFIDFAGLFLSSDLIYETNLMKSANYSVI